MAEIVTERIIRARPEAIFACISNPEALARWWGPKGFSNTFHEFDFRPGGSWRFTMHGPNGADYANQSEFVAIVPPREVVIRHVSPPPFVLTISLEPREGGTLLRWQGQFATAAELERVKKFAPEANEQNLDRLEVELARQG
jgi:uncharacterized protein YndB with AHSA1/START domain